MKLDEIVVWYQKKIGTYDKQQWEKTVEQKILDGFSSVSLKTAKLKTELIDVDLVRGSTFPKAKPKQTLLTVIRLAILRYLFLPIYAQWWVRQTSPNIFGILIFLYITQMINWAVYTFNIHRLNLVQANNTSSDNINATISNNNIQHAPNVLPKIVEEPIVSLTELLIPMALSLLLSLIHSQIVATNSAGSSSSIKSKLRRFSNTSSNASKTSSREMTRVRRRKKLVKLRSQEASDGAVDNLLNSTTMQQRKQTSSSARKFNLGAETVTKTTYVPLEANNTSAAATNTTLPLENNINTDIIIINSRQEALETTTTNETTTHASHQVSKLVSMFDSSNATIPKLKLDLNSSDTITPQPSTLIDRCYNLGKKRNVNWHSPIHNYAIETQEKHQQTSPQTTASSDASSPTSGSNSSSSSSSSGGNNDNNRCSNSKCSTKTVRIDDCVQEFYNDLASQAAAATAVNHLEVPPAASNAKRSIGDDDGFESLNGKSSSGEETNTPFSSAVLDTSSNQQLRFRLNAGDLSGAIRNAAETAEATNKPGGIAFRRKFPLSSESDYERSHVSCTDMVLNQPKKIKQPRSSKSVSTDETDEEGDDDAELVTSPISIASSSNYNECTTSATEWLGVTTNSEDCSYSSELDNSDDYKKHSAANSDDDYDGHDLDFTPTTILNPHGTTADRISCTIWDHRDAKKAQMSVLEISSCIIERVESMPETNDYIYIGIFFSLMLSLVPSFCRLCEVTIDSDNPSEINYFDLPMLLWKKASFSFMTIFRFAFGHTQWERTVLIIGFVQRLCLTLILFIIFAVAERTFKQRFLYGKLFSHLTSSRRARKSNLPHFRLNKVRNIKAWLSVRSYLKKRGPQRSVDVIVSAAFIVTLLLLAFLSVEWLKDSVHLHSHLNLEALIWSTTIGTFLLRFMTLGNKIHDKYRSVSVLITEQINLYLQIEQKPKKKDELMVSNSVLKLAADLLKELESPFKISGLSANPYLFTTIKVVILSALSGVLSEMLGFKLKLHKIKIK